MLLLLFGLLVSVSAFTTGKSAKFCVFFCLFRIRVVPSALGSVPMVTIGVKGPLKLLINANETNTFWITTAGIYQVPMTGPLPAHVQLVMISPGNQEILDATYESSSGNT